MNFLKKTLSTRIGKEVAVAAGGSLLYGAHIIDEQQIFNLLVSLIGG